MASFVWILWGLVTCAAAQCNPAIENPVLQITDGDTAKCTAGRLVVDGEISSAYNMTIAAQVTITGTTQLGTGAGTAGDVWTSIDTMGKGEWAAASGGIPTDVLETVGDLEIENQNTTGNILVKMGFTWASPLVSTGEFRVEDTASDAAIVVNSARAVRLAHYVEIGDPAATGTGTHVYHSGPRETTTSSTFTLTTDQVLKGFYWAQSTTGSNTVIRYPTPLLVIAALLDVGITATENMYLPISYTRWGTGGGSTLRLSCDGCDGSNGYNYFYGPGSPGASTSTLTIPLNSVCHIQYMFSTIPPDAWGGANIFVGCQV